MKKAQLVKIITKSIDWHTMMLPRTKKDGSNWTKSELTQYIANDVADDLFKILKVTPSKEDK